MRCPHCHADIPDGASPCPRCGKPADDSRGRVLEPELVDANHHPLRPGRSEGGNAYDSSGGFTRIFYTTFPGGQGMPPACLPTIITLTLMSIGKIFYSDFGLFYQVPQNSGPLINVTQTIDTYVYRGLMTTSNIGMSSAAGVYQSIVGFILVVSANLVVRKLDSDSALF